MPSLQGRGGGAPNWLSHLLDTKVEVETIPKRHATHHTLSQGPQARTSSMKQTGKGSGLALLASGSGPTP